MYNTRVKRSEIPILKTFVIRSFFFKKWLLTHVLGGAQGHKSSCKHACVAFLTFFPWYHHIYIKNRNKKGVPFPWNSHQNLPDSFARPPATKKTGTNGPWNFVKLFARSTNASAPVPVINTATKNNCLTAIPLRLFLAQYLFSLYATKKSDPAASNICKTRPFNAPSGTRTLDK